MTRANVNTSVFCRNVNCWHSKIQCHNYEQQLQFLLFLLVCHHLLGDSDTSSSPYENIICPPPINITLCSLFSAGSSSSSISVRNLALGRATDTHCFTVLTRGWGWVANKCSDCTEWPVRAVAHESAACVGRLWHEGWSCAWPSYSGFCLSLEGIILRSDTGKLGGCMNCEGARMW